MKKWPNYRGMAAQYWMSNQNCLGFYFWWLEAEMSPAQRVNCQADKVATAALMATEEANEFISSIFLLEKFCVEIAGERVTRSPKNAITELWGQQVAQALYDWRGVVVSKENFPFVYWEGMEHVMKLFPEMSCIWVTKHVSHFQGTNRQLSCIDKPVLSVSKLQV